jgi:hypothetical protein
MHLIAKNIPNLSLDPHLTYTRYASINLAIGRSEPWKHFSYPDPQFDFYEQWVGISCNEPL